MNEVLTAYLYGLYTLRGGRLTAADAMDHVVNLLAGAQRAQSSLTQVASLAGFWRKAVKAEGRS